MPFASRATLILSTVLLFGLLYSTSDSHRLMVDEVLDEDHLNGTFWRELGRDLPDQCIECVLARVKECAVICSEASSGLTPCGWQAGKRRHIGTICSV